MRFGERLIEEGLITLEQLDLALKSQRHYGGRLGTNLVDLQFLDSDAIARALARHHGVAPALAKHFQHVDERLKALLPQGLADRYDAVPLGLTTTQPHRLVVAFMDPTPPNVEAVSFALSRRLEAGVGPEHQVARYLEVLYGISREARAVRLQMGFASALVGTGLEPVAMPAVGVNSMPPMNRAARTAGAEPGRDSWGHPAMEPETGELTPPAWFHERSSESRTDTELAPPPDAERSLPAEPVVQPAPAPAVPAPAPVVSARAPAVSAPAAPARVAHVPLATSPSPGVATAPVPAAPRPALGTRDAMDAMARAERKDDIGDALVDYLRSSFGAGVVCIVKEDMILGWKGFAADVDPTVLESLGLPLTAPSMFKLACESKAPFRGAPPTEGTAVHSRFFKLLRTPPPLEVVVAPILLGSRVVNVVYAHAFDGGVLPSAAVTDVLTVCRAAADGYTRLIRTGR